MVCGAYSTNCGISSASRLISRWASITMSGVSRFSDSVRSITSPLRTISKNKWWERGSHNQKTLHYV